MPSLEVGLIHRCLLKLRSHHPPSRTMLGRCRLFWVVHEQYPEQSSVSPCPSSTSVPRYRSWCHSWHPIAPSCDVATVDHLGDWGCLVMRPYYHFCKRHDGEVTDKVVERKWMLTDGSHYHVWSMRTKSSIKTAIWMWTVLIVGWLKYPISELDGQNWTLMLVGWQKIDFS